MNSEIQIGTLWKLRNTKFVYKVFDITGRKQNIPNETPIIYLIISDKVGLFNYPQRIITITERTFFDHFQYIFDKVEL